MYMIPPRTLNHRPSSYSAYLLLGGLALILGSACTSVKQRGGKDIATGGSGGPANHDLADKEPWDDAPPHRMQARAHEEHRAPTVAALPAFSSMPAFVDGSSRCFPQPKYEAYSSGGSHRLAGSHKSGANLKPRPRSQNATGAASDGVGMDSFGMIGHAPEESASSKQPANTNSKGAEKEDRGRDKERLDEEYTSNEPEGKKARPSDDGWGAGIYLSNDDTMSLSSAQRVIWAIDHYAPIPESQIRPHELLNYFSFDTDDVAADHDFSVKANIAQSAFNPELLSLGLAVQGRELSKDTRRNVNLSYVIDRSGSMSAEGRMEYLKRGLLRSLKELKQGDIVHLSLFDDNACDLAKNFVVGRDSMSRLEGLINKIQPRGSTNLNAGLLGGYAAANGAYQPTYNNRVILISDAQTNTGITDENMISTIAKQYDDRKIRLSGVGVGSDFNDSLLDSLTERGKGAYVFLGSGAEVDAVFGDRFVSLIETIANDVHFKLQLPPSLGMQTFYGEEASTVKERVQAIHYFANTSQMFLSDLKVRGGNHYLKDDIMLTIEYEDAEASQSRVEEFVWNLGDIAGNAANLDKATLLTRFAKGLADISAKPVPSKYDYCVAGWHDDTSAELCENIGNELSQLGSKLGSDPEVRRVKQLWDTVCQRYAPIQNARPTPKKPQKQGWPEAQPGGDKATVRHKRTNEYAP